MKNSEHSQQSKTSLWIIVLYLISSVFAGLIFSLLALNAKSKGNLTIVWFLLSLLCVAGFGYLGLGFYKTSSATIDPFYYYLGLTTLVSNGLALFFLVLTIIKK